MYICIFYLLTSIKYKFGGIKLIIVLGGIIILFSSKYFISGQKSNVLQKHIQERSHVFKEKNIIDKLGVFDAAALNFLTKKPKYLLTGAGPGLISIPSTAYVTKAYKHFWNNLLGLPHMGLILIFSNGGIIGVVLGLVIWGMCFNQGISRFKC